jgi:hypothetical protein
MNGIIAHIFEFYRNKVRDHRVTAAGLGESPTEEPDRNWRMIMMLRTTVPLLAACLALTGGAAFAGDGSKASAGTYGAGGAEANATGASAGGEVAGDARARMEERRADRNDRRKSRHSGAAASANSASTYGSGAVSTTRNSANAGVTTGGAASGQGVQSTGSTVDAYGETTKDGSNADIYGDSTATSGAKP